MNDYLSRLAAKNLNILEVVMPRLPSFFESIDFGEIGYRADFPLEQATNLDPQKVSFKTNDKEFVRMDQIEHIEPKNQNESASGQRYITAKSEFKPPSIQSEFHREKSKFFLSEENCASCREVPELAMFSKTGDFRMAMKNPIEYTHGSFNPVEPGQPSSSESSNLMQEKPALSKSFIYERDDSQETSTQGAFDPYFPRSQDSPKRNPADGKHPNQTMSGSTGRRIPPKDLAQRISIKPDKKIQTHELQEQPSSGKQETSVKEKSFDANSIFGSKVVVDGALRPLPSSMKIAAGKLLVLLPSGHERLQEMKGRALKRDLDTEIIGFVEALNDDRSAMHPERSKKESLFDTNESDSIKTGEFSNELPKIIRLAEQVHRGEMAERIEPVRLSSKGTEATIRVTIGRVEVMATTPPSSPPPPIQSAPEENGRLSLDQYLKQRSSGLL